MSEIDPGSRTRSATDHAVAPDGVVVGADGSPGAEAAVAWAAREARSRGATLTLVHALSLPEVSVAEPSEFALQSRQEGRDLLDGVVARLCEDGTGPRIKTLLTDLAPAQALQELSRHCAVVVTGTRGHGGFPGMALGSVSRRLAAHARCPLVVVPGSRPPPQALDEVVVGVEPGQAGAVLAFAFAAAARYGAFLHAVRAWWPPGFRTGAGGRFTESLSRIREAETAQVEQLLEPLRPAYPKVDAGVMAWRGNTVPILVEAARDTRLLVLGAHRRRGPLTVGAGYVVDGVLAHSRTPVAVVPIH